MEFCKLLDMTSPGGSHLLITDNIFMNIFKQKIATPVLADK